MNYTFIHTTSFITMHQPFSNYNYFYAKVSSHILISFVSNFVQRTHSHSNGENITSGLKSSKYPASQCSA